VKDAFELLSREEKLYAHYVGVASWAGARIIQAQWTPQAPDLYDLLVLVFTNEEGKCVNFDKLKEDSQSSEEQWKHALSYAAQVFGNLLNYKSFGFTKFVPRIKINDFKRIIEACPNHEKAKPLWDKLSDYIYTVEPESEMLIGDPNKGHVSNYYLGRKSTEEE
ncbi:1884_t:CDS:2, partial [Acaulospora colombiana]